MEPLPEMHMTEAGAAISQKAEAKDGVPINGVEDEESRPPETNQGRGELLSGPKIRNHSSSECAPTNLRLHASSCVHLRASFCIFFFRKRARYFVM